MKKLVTLLLTAALAITAATTAFATDIQIGAKADGSPSTASNGIPVTYTAAPSYTVTIPATIALDSQTKQGEAKVKAENVTVDYGKSVKVALSTDFHVALTNVNATPVPTLKYEVHKGNDVVPNDGIVLEVAPNATDKKGEETLTFAIVGDIMYSGTYTGTVTFTVSVGNKTT